ncbi:B3 domain-containing protein Os01g0723500-like [Macadamia integrifolia]|uniref:B3 domain-containing protein Os01g0723500-like n=1 Tax=Macadamia integrifolia TaxID=60698 RepID=UPI001C500CB8|nr:B3 domain-containing protein Os01g0723500-like [Macadamia integrifolia]
MVKKSKSLPPEERLHFFKIMLPGFCTRLRIPPDFVKHISPEAYELATLEDSTGSQWPIKLSKTTEGTYLEDGWQDFVKDHSIDEYNFLLFGYDRNTCFSVNIFDKSACETSDSVLQASKYDPGKHLPSRKPKRLKKVRREEVELTDKPCSKTKCSSSRRRPATEEEKAEVLKEAESFTSKFPCFLKCLNASNVYRGFYLSIPSNFARTHLHIQQKGEVTLRNREGQTWRVNIIKFRRKTALCAGWPAFVHANQLEEADICIFELVGKFKLQFHIFRAVK